MLNLVLALGAFFGVLILGAFAIMVVNPHRRWRGYAALDKTSQGAQRTFPPAFQPLHMEPFTLKWPSQVQRKSAEIGELPWPSETWDDDYFGQRARDDVKRIAKTAAAIDAKRARSAQEANRVREEHDAQEASRNATRQQVRDDAAARSQDKKERRRDRRKEKRRKQTAREQKRLEPTPVPLNSVTQPKAQPRQPSPPPQAAPAAPASGAPSAAEIGQLVKQLGLGGAVEEIRKRTGWDFRRSAQYLADTLRNK